MDAPAVNALLDIILKTRDIPTLKAVTETASNELAQINAELEAELRPPPEPVEPVEGDV
jgi:hypothetical protein